MAVNSAASSASASRRAGGAGWAAVMLGPQYSPAGVAHATAKRHRAGDGRHVGPRPGTAAARLRQLGLRRRLVQDQPVEAELADGLDELPKVPGVSDVAVRPQAVPADPI